MSTELLLVVNWIHCLMLAVCTAHGQLGCYCYGLVSFQALLGKRVSDPFRLTYLITHREYLIFFLNKSLVFPLPFFPLPSLSPSGLLYTRHSSKYFTCFNPEKVIFAVLSLQMNPLTYKKVK